MAFRASDARIFLRDGETAVLVKDGTEFKCILEFPDIVADLGGLSSPGVNVAKPVIQFETAAVTMDPEDEITINDETYQIASAPRRMGDGVMSFVELNKGS